MVETEVTDLLGLKVYTPKGYYLGIVDNVMIDIEGAIIWELLLTETNPEIVDGGRDISIPYRWVKAIDEIVVLSYFPGRIRVVKKRRGKPKLRVTKKERTKGVPREEWR